MRILIRVRLEKIRVRQRKDEGRYLTIYLYQGKVLVISRYLRYRVKPEQIPPHT